MKKFLSIIALLATVAISCQQKEQSEETTREIADIKMQVTSITQSIQELERMDLSLKSYISTLQEQVILLQESDEGFTAAVSTISSAITLLQSKDVALEAKIDQLRNYVDTELKKKEEWVSATFATLEQLDQISGELAALEASITAFQIALQAMSNEYDTALSDAVEAITSEYQTAISQAIQESENSLKGWVSDQLTGYYTIAETDAKLDLLEAMLKEEDERQAGELNELREELKAAKDLLTKAYQKAIADAIIVNNGVIDEKIAADIKAATDTFQTQIDILTTRLSNLEDRVAALEASLAEIIGMVQSVVVVPDYSDGSVQMTDSEENVIRFEIYPLSAAQKMTKADVSTFSLNYTETQTKSSSLKSIPISGVYFEDGILSVVADGSGLSDSVKTGNVSANARLLISYGGVVCSSSYFQLTYVPSSNPWDENRGKVVRPTAGGGWTVTTVEPGIIYYAFDGYESVSGANQRIFVTEIDLNNPAYAVKLVYRPSNSTASTVFSSTGAIACINAGYETPALWLRVGGVSYSNISAETIGTTGVPQWKSEAAVYLDQERDVRIRFTGKDMNVAQWRSIYFDKAKTENNFITSAPMLLDDYEPVGLDFCAKHPASAYPDIDGKTTNSENPYNHQGSLTNARTALAQTAEGQLFFIVVDGRRGAGVARGISCAQLTSLLVKYFNPQYAINMDGGGSSTMVVKGQGDPTTHVVNYPTDSDQVSGVPDHSGERSRNTFFCVVKE